jgi:death-on-curing protein
MIPDFLTLEDVLDIHPLQLARFGGGEGVRERGLLESALAQPQATFGGEYVHADVWDGRWRGPISSTW